jgi:hypothetical protein
LSSKATKSAVLAVITFSVLSANLINRLNRILVSFYYGVVVTVIAPLVGNDTLKVARSPTAPLTGVKLVTSALKLYEGVVADAAVPLPAISTIGTTVPTRSAKVSDTASAPKSWWKSRDTLPDFSPPITSTKPPEPKSVVSTSAALIVSSARAQDAETSTELTVTDVDVTTNFAIFISPIMPRR